MKRIDRGVQYEKVNCSFVLTAHLSSTLIQINLDYTMSKIIYKVFYNRLIYIGLKRIVTVIKNTEISISWIEAIEFYYYYYTILKSICVIFYTSFHLAVRLFVKIYVDIIEYKLLSTNKYKYIVYILDCYFNY